MAMYWRDDQLLRNFKTDNNDHFHRQANLAANRGQFYYMKITMLWLNPPPNTTKLDRCNRYYKLHPKLLLQQK